MKYNLLIVVLAAVFIFGCNKDEEEKPETSELIIGTWEVTKYKVVFTEALAYEYYLEGVRIENGTYTVDENKVYLKAIYSSYGCSTTATDQYYTADATETTITLTAGNDPCPYRKLCLNGRTFNKL